MIDIIIGLLLLLGILGISVILAVWVMGWLEGLL